MNATANALGLGMLLCTAVGLALVLVTPVTDHTHAWWIGGVIGLGCSGLYIAGMLVGQADERRRSTSPGAGEESGR